jgi:uncharacterized protein
VVQVRVLEVDAKRKRISLSMRSEKDRPDKRDTAKAPAKEHGRSRQTAPKRGQPKTPRQKPAASDGALALALSKALSRKA